MEKTQANQGKKSILFIFIAILLVLIIILFFQIKSINQVSKNLSETNLRVVEVEQTTGNYNDKLSAISEDFLSIESEMREARSDKDSLFIFYDERLSKIERDIKSLLSFQKKQDEANRVTYSKLFVIEEGQINLRQAQVKTDSSVYNLSSSKTSPTNIVEPGIIDNPENDDKKRKRPRSERTGQ